MVRLIVSSPRWWIGTDRLPSRIQVPKGSATIAKQRIGDVHGVLERREFRLDRDAGSRQLQRLQRAAETFGEIARKDATCAEAIETTLAEMGGTYQELIAERDETLRHITGALEVRKAAGG